MCDLSIIFSAYLSVGLFARNTSRTDEYDPSPIVSTVTKSRISKGRVVDVDDAAFSEDTESPRVCDRWWLSPAAGARSVPDMMDDDDALACEDASGAEGRGRKMNLVFINTTV
jgi:hypothetical protein